MMPSSRLRRLATLLVVLGFAACGGSEPAPATDAGGDAARATTAAPDAEYARSLGVPNASEPIPGLITAGQPDQAQLQALAEAGVGTAISLRPAGETGAGWEEAFAGGGSLDFHRVPVAGAPDLSRETVEELDRLLAQAGDGPTVLYCASSNRVGALLALRAHWLQGVPADEALALGREAGLTRLEPAVAELLGTDGG